MQETKQCTKCNAVKPVEKFPCSIGKLKDGTVKKYREHVCYKCRADKESEHPLFIERRTARQRKYNLKNPHKKMYWGSKKRATDKGFEFSIDLSDIVIPEYCPLLGIKLMHGTGFLIDESPSLDRIDSKKGYVKGNVWVISHKANTMKSDATLEELELLVKNLRDKINEG
jgi:hypothetical protein